jgi:hypothetical protein
MERYVDAARDRDLLAHQALWSAGAGAMCIFLGLLSAPLRLRLPAAPSVDEAGAAAARALGVPAPAMLSFAGGARLPTAAPDTSSSAESSVRIGDHSPSDSESGPHGAD